jgi:lipid-binding SYLF domain-containing protein
MTSARFALVSILLLACVTLSPTVRAQTKSESDEARRIQDAATIFTEIMGADDKAVPKSILEKAAGIAVFPSTITAGFVVGGTRGRGVMSVREGGTWSSPAFLTLTGASIGAQIGGQATDLILVITNRRGVENLVHNQFKVGADASVSAGPVGRDTQAATDIQMRAEILSYSRSRGVFAGISLNGTTFHQDKDANGRFYGKPLETQQIVFEHLGGAPEPVHGWVAMLDKYTK